MTAPEFRLLFLIFNQLDTTLAKEAIKIEAIKTLLNI